MGRDQRHIVPPGGQPGHRLQRPHGDAASCARRLLLGALPWSSDARGPIDDDERQRRPSRLSGLRSARRLAPPQAVGFGHATLSSAQHAPFLFALDLRTLGLRLSFNDPASAATPFRGFTYIDPTAWWQEAEPEAEPEAAVLEPEAAVAEPKAAAAEAPEPEKKARAAMRTLVMCTLRAAPDYLSFEPAHHQTVVFEATSRLLADVMYRETEATTPAEIVAAGAADTPEGPMSLSPAFGRGRPDLPAALQGTPTGGIEVWV